MIFLGGKTPKDWCNHTFCNVLFAQQILTLLEPDIEASEIFLYAINYNLDTFCFDQRATRTRMVRLIYVFWLMEIAMAAGETTTVTLPMASCVRWLLELSNQPH